MNIERAILELDDAVTYLELQLDEDVMTVSEEEQLHALADRLEEILNGPR